MVKNCFLAPPVTPRLGRARILMQSASESLFFLAKKRKMKRKCALFFLLGCSLAFQVHPFFPVASKISWQSWSLLAFFALGPAKTEEHPLVVLSIALILFWATQFRLSEVEILECWQCIPVSGTKSTMALAHLKTLFPQ